MGGSAENFLEDYSLSDVTGARAEKATNKAMQYELAAAREAQAFQEKMFNRLEGHQQPYLEAGAGAVGQQAAMSGAAGIGAQRDFYNNYMLSPESQFQMKQGFQGIDAGAAANQALLGSDRLKALNEYGQGIASQDISNRFNRLGALSGMGAGAASALGGVGSNTSSGIASNIIGGGEAAAGSIMAAQQGQAQKNSNIMGMAGMFMSDCRLKSDVKVTGKHGELDVCSWTWNPLAEILYGLTGEDEGHLAQQVKLIHPDLVQENDDGYLMMSYDDNRTMNYAH